MVAKTPAGKRNLRRTQAEETAKVPERDGAAASLHKLYERPEFLIRRAHQVASATFVDACKGLDLTPSQYAALFTLRQYGSVSQNELGRLVALDRSTTSVVLKSLKDRALVDAHADPADRRKTQLSLTNAGRLTLGEAERLSARSSDALLATLGGKKAKQLLSLLQQLADSAGGDGGD